MKKLLTSLLTSIFVFGTLSAQFTHPGVTSSREELDKMKQQVADGSDAARTSGWNKLKSESCSSLSYSPNFRTIVYADNGTSGNFGLDALAAYSQALQWYITGNQANADKAISILNGYSSKLTSIVTSSASANGDQEVPVAGWAGATFCEAAEIIRYSNAGWAAADITKFENMMINVFYPIVKYHRSENGNWEASEINTMAAIGVFCNRQDIFDQAISWAKGSSRGGITTYIYASGECQETCRDQRHTQMGIGELIETCEIAWHQGIDLYSWSADANGLPRLAKGLEYTAKVINNVCMPSSCGTKCESFSNGYYMWETSWNHYGNRMGRTDMQYTKKNAEVNGRPAGITGWQGQFGFQTLTHANMSINSTPPVPDPIAPTAPSALAISNISDISFNLTWTAGTDNNAVTEYEVYLNGVYKTSLSGTTGTVNGLIPVTTYEVTLVSKDAAGNSSPASSSISVTTAAGCGAAIPWTSFPIASQTGTFTAEFDATPASDNMDGLIGFSTSTPSGSLYSLIACATQFKTSIFARNAAVYVAENVLASAASTKYHVKMVVNVATRKYDVFVTPQGGTEVTIGTNYAFRTEQANVTSLNYCSIITQNCNLKLENLVVAGTAISTGLSNNNITEVNKNLRIYPNPLTQNADLTIDFGENLEKANVEIFDINGKIVYIRSIENASKLNLMTSGILNKGFYIVRINEDQDSLNLKFIVF